MKIVIHIGRGKTGTTAIQYSLGLDRARLAEHGVLYPDAGANRKHAHHRWALAVEWATGQTRDGDESRLDELVGSLRQEIEAASPSIVVLSSEVLSRVVDPSPLTDALADVSDDLQLVVMVRRQDSLLEAQYAQQVSAGLTTAGPDEFLEAILDSGYLDHEEVVDRWVGPLGTDRIRLVPYEPDVAPVDSAAVLAEVAGLPVAPQPTVRNERLSRRAVEVLRGMPPERRTAAVFDSLFDALRAWAPADEEPAGWQHFWARDIRREVLARYSAPNERLASRFDLGGSLFVGEPAPDGDIFPGLTVQDAIDAARHLWESGLGDKRRELLATLARDADDTEHEIE